MTTAAPSGLDDLPEPRRLVVTGLIGDVLGRTRELAGLYARLAATATPPVIRPDLGELGRAEAAHAAVLESLAGPAAPAAPPRQLPASLALRGQGLAVACQAERALEGAYRVLLSLLGECAEAPRVKALAADTASHRQQLLRLYLRYS